jgi:hypothetical protein
MHRQNGVLASPEADTVIIPRRSLANPLGRLKILCGLVLQDSLVSSLGVLTRPAKRCRLQIVLSRAIALCHPGCLWCGRLCQSKSGHGASPAVMFADRLVVSFAYCQQGFEPRSQAFSLADGWFR